MCFLIDFPDRRQQIIITWTLHNWYTSFCITTRTLRWNSNENGTRKTTLRDKIIIIHSKIGWITGGGTIFLQHAMRSTSYSIIARFIYSSDTQTQIVVRVATCEHVRASVNVYSVHRGSYVYIGIYICVYVHALYGIRRGSCVKSQTLNSRAMNAGDKHNNNVLHKHIYYA